MKFNTWQRAGSFIQNGYRGVQPRTRLNLILCIVAILLASPHQAQAQVATTGDLTTLEDALLSALENNSVLEVERQTLISSFEDVPTARSGFLPSIDLSVKLNPWSTAAIDGKFSDGLRTVSETLTIEQPVFSWLRTYFDVQEANQNVEIAFSLFEARQQEILIQAARAYTGVLTERIRLRMRKSNLEQMQSRADAARERFALGGLNRPDLALVEAELARAVAGFVDGRRTLEESEQLIRDTTGRNASLTAAFPIIPKLAISESEDGFVAQVLALNPRLKALSIGRDIAEMRYGQSRATPLPLSVKLTGRAEWRQKLGDQKNVTASQNFIDQNYSVGVQANILLYSGGRAGSLRRKIHATRDRLRAQYTDLQQQVTRQAKITFRRLQDQKTLLDAAERALSAQRIVQEAYESGEQLGLYSRLDVLEARRLLLQAQLNLITTRARNVDTDLDILALVGQFSPGGLGYVDEDTDQLRRMYKNVRWRFDPLE